MIDRPFTTEEQQARALLSRFTPEEPFLAGQAVYDAMAKEPALADMMDRVRLYGTLPAGFEAEPDVDWNKPEAWDYLRSVARGTDIVIVTSTHTPASWVRDLWDFPGTVIYDAPDCQHFSASDAVMIFGNEEHPVKDLRLYQEKSRWPEVDMQRALYASDFVLWDETVEMKGVVTMDELKAALGPMEPEPVGRRYGPYDADPHMKGRRRRFRKQRKT